MDKKETIIETYTVPDHSDDLSERIIMAARQMPQKTSILDRLKAWTTAFQTPAMSYSFASILVVGLLVGGMIYKTPDISPTTSSITLADLLDEEESLLIL